MLNKDIFTHVPLSSADSTNVARNIGIDKSWVGSPYAPASKETRTQVLVERIESFNSASSLNYNAERDVFTLSWHSKCEANMTIEHNNALRSIARQANCEIKKARQQFPDKNVDDICRSVLKKHRETVTLMGFTPTHLSLAIGMLNGVFKER